MKPLFSFGVIADCQYADKDDATAMSSDTRHIHDNRYRLSSAKLKEAVDFFNEHDLEFIVHLGDFVDCTFEDYAAPMLEIASTSKAPFWHVLGNHEYHQTNLNEAEILATYGLSTSYYVKSLHSYRFVVLDTNELGTVKYQKGTPEWECGNAYLQTYKDAGRPNAYPWNGAIGPEQMQWLRGQLEEAHAASEKVILFAHHPVFPPNGANALNDEQILQTIDESPGIVAFINGHNHFGNTGIRKSVPYITMPAIVEGETNAYSIATVYEGALEFISYGHAQDLWVETS